MTAAWVVSPKLFGNRGHLNARTGPFLRCGIFTALVNHDNPILLELLEGLLGVKFLCVVSTVIWISWLVSFFCNFEGMSSLDQNTASEKTSDVAESAGWLVLGVAPQLGTRRMC